MNWDRVEGNWKQFKGQVKEKWAKLTDDDLRLLEGKKDQLVGKIQERYGCRKDEAERQVDDWLQHHPEEVGVGRGDRATDRSRY